MARYTGPSYKQSRRVGFSLSETGKELARRPYGPGQHGKDRKGKASNYAEQLKEKQSVKDVARIANVSSTTVIRLLPYLSVSTSYMPEVLCIDEFRGNTGNYK